MKRIGNRRRQRPRVPFGSTFLSGDLIYWEQCQVRTTAYLTTNGQIEISLCGLFATTVAVLTTLGQSQADHHHYAVFALVIPAFSLVVLILSSRVYVWIREQLEYSAIAGLHPSRHITLLSLEEWQEVCTAVWRQLPFLTRFARCLWRCTVLYVTLPVRIRDIYMCYFLLYLIVPMASAIYAANHGTAWEIPVLWGILGYGFLCASISEVERYAYAREHATAIIFGSKIIPTYGRMAQETVGTKS